MTGHFSHIPMLLKISNKGLKRGLSTSTICPRCGDPMESCEHLFKDCAATLVIWNMIEIGVVEHSQSSNTFEDWLFHNLKSKRIVLHGMP